MANEQDKLEVTVKFKVMPFPVSICIWEEEYIVLLGSFEYEGLEIQAVLMQTIGHKEVWVTSPRSLEVGPLKSSLNTWEKTYGDITTDEV